MSAVSPGQVAAGRLAGLRNKTPRDPIAITAARHDLTEIKLERAIREALAAKPLLPVVRRVRLAQILVDGGDR
jgi:hypothetical protein